MRYKISLLSLIILGGAYCLAAAQENKPAPNFILNDVSGKPVNLSSFKGKVVFLDFWASWCGPCRNSIPAVEDLYRKFEKEGVVFFGINLENNPVLAGNFAKNTGITYTVLVGDQKTTRAYGVRGIPAFFLLDRDGNIAQTYVGYDPQLKDRWESDIKALLSKNTGIKPKSPTRKK